MHAVSSNKPTQAQLVLPLLEVLDERGGQAKAIDVAVALADRFKIPESVRNEVAVTGDGQIVNVWRRHIRFVRQKAMQMGYVGGGDRGLWALTPEGEQGIRQTQTVVVVRLVTDALGLNIGAQIEVNTTIPTIHTLHQGDARDMGWIGNGEIPLIVTSVPYFDVIDYKNDPGQLAIIPTYDGFVEALTDAIRECYRVLMPGGKLLINVGDVLRSRKKHGVHQRLPLHSHIEVNAFGMGFELLTGILWKKIGKVNFEQGGAGILGQPGQPNQIIPQGYEHILSMRKPGPYRKPEPWQRAASVISKDEHARWYQPVWGDVPGARATQAHPAPYPVEIPYRLIRMNSFVGDTVLDLFGGEGNTTRAAMKARRHSVYNEIHGPYVDDAIEKSRRYAESLAA